MYNYLSMTKIHKLPISQYDFSHTEFKLESIHTSHSYIIYHDFSYTEFNQKEIWWSTERKLQKRVLSVARQLLVQTSPINNLPYTPQNRTDYRLRLPFSRSDLPVATLSW